MLQQAVGQQHLGHEPPESGSMRITTSAPSAISVTWLTTATPFHALVPRPGGGADVVDPEPVAGPARRPTMGVPMWPSPAKPIVAILSARRCTRRR